MDGALKDEHLRYLEKWGLVRPLGGRYSSADLHAVRPGAAERDRGAALPALLRALSADRAGQLAFDFQPRAERAAARVVTLPTKSATKSAFPATESEDVQAAN